MDNKKISKTHIKKHKRLRYSLHDRIELFEKKKINEAKSLMAIKWIGNSGSHTGDTLTKDGLLDGFDILEDVILKIYDTDSTRIKKLTSAINKRKKPIGQNPFC